MKAKDLLVEFYDPEDDESMYQEYDDTRRPRLTLRRLNKLRKAKDMRDLDNAEHLAFLPTMYAQPTGEEEGGGGDIPPI